MQDIQVFISFANFYWYFIQGFSKIAAALTSILKMNKSLDLAPRKLETNKVIGGDGKADNKNLSKKSKNAKFRIQMHNGVTEKLTFLIFGTKEVFS